MDTLQRDVRFALRTFARRKAVALGAVASLAIAIAANTAVFSVANGLLLKGVPGVTRPERLVEIGRSIGNGATDITHPIYRYLRGQTTVLEDVAAFALTPVSVSAGDEPAMRGALVVTGNYFDLLGTRAARGRLFGADEASYPAVQPVAVITHDVWQRELGGADDVIGRVARVNGTPVRIIGVTPPGFAGHHTGLLADVFLPLGLAVPGLPNPATFNAGNGSSLELLGRLRAGITREQATRALDASVAPQARELGESTAERPYRLRIDAWGPLFAGIRGPIALFFTVLLALVGLALAMACINVATMLLAHASERRRELAVRRAMGASERRLVRQMLTEIGLLFVAGGVAGVTLAGWSVGLIGGVDPPVSLPGRLGLDVGLDIRVLAFSLVVTLGVALAFSLPVALNATRFHLPVALREGGASGTKGRARFRSLLVGAQVALSCVLLSATVLFGRALASMRAFDPGWNGDGVYISTLDFQQSGTPPAVGAAQQREILARLSTNRAIEVAAFATELPEAGPSSLGSVIADGVRAPNGWPGFEAWVNRVTPGYLGAMRIPILRGRDIAATDDDRSARVAVVSASLARTLWGAADPVGKSFFVLQPKQRLELRVIGVARDAEQRTRRFAVSNFYYVPAAQWYNPEVTLHVRARPGHEAEAAAAIRPAVRAVNPALVVTSVRALDDAMAVYQLPQRLAAWVSAAMGTFGLLLAIVGIYGVTTFVMARRSREVAIRMALGATAGAVIRLLMQQGARAPMIGAAVGTVLAMVAAIAASKVVAGTRATDPVLVLGVPVLVATVVGTAMFAPIRRLVRASPMTNLRED